MVCGQYTKSPGAVRPIHPKNLYSGCHVCYTPPSTYATCLTPLFCLVLFALYRAHRAMVSTSDQSAPAPNKKLKRNSYTHEHKHDTQYTERAHLQNQQHRSNEMMINCIASSIAPACRLHCQRHFHQYQNKAVPPASQIYTCDS